MHRYYHRERFNRAWRFAASDVRAAGPWIESPLSGIAKVELATIPGVNHLFIKGTGKPGPAEYQVPGHVDETVIAKLASFVAGEKSR